MLWRAEDLYGIKLRGPDATIGRIRDLLFDEASWTVRYLVAEEVAWPFPRTFFLSPFAVKQINWQARTCLVAVSRKQVAVDSRLRPAGTITTQPPATLDRSSQRHPITGVSAPIQPGYETEPSGMLMLKSARNLGTFAVQTKDGRAGRVTDLLIQREDWIIRDLLVNVQTPGLYRRTLITPRQIEEIDWIQGKIFLDYLSPKPGHTAPAGLTGSMSPPPTRRAS